MDMDIRTYNGCSLKNKIDAARDFTEQHHDFIFLQEILISEDSLGDIMYSGEKYDCIGAPALY